ncbi:preprotein translocase subunit Sss1 [Saonia flava]|uniref:Preprotein translocase subunit Sss1 n=1 Tax=Saonia flava TaxID=523696 RepID=A0A846QV14_9FLAO|nr:hypothetical protein [Saonia flava]NJB72101.1 preprotein translocase subunit Sss1 [Saonia flava]
MLHNKFWQGFFALAPFISLFFILIGYFFFMYSIFNNLPELEEGSHPPMEFWRGFGIFFIMIFAMIFLSLGSLIFYIVHAVQNPNLKENNMVLVWVLLFIFVGGIGQLIYWIVEIINKRKETSFSD